MSDQNIHPIDWYLFNGVFKDIFKGIRDHQMINDNEAALINPNEPTANDLNQATFICDGATVRVVKDNKYSFTKGSTVTKFMLMSAIQFKSDNQSAISYIQFELMGLKCPYIRVRCDYLKVIEKEDRYSGTQTILVSWKKEEIKQDHSKSLMNAIPKFDDFVIVPDNKNYHPIVKNCYNLYSKFPHTPHPEPVTESDIPVTWQFLNHIFNDGTPEDPQLDLGLTYFKVLYEYPKQILPILALISKPRNTGKTTFNNWLNMIFGDNYVSISPESLTKSFNSNYATKNIITFEEAFIEKQAGIEKLKHMSTGKSIDVSQKFISEYSIPFFGKFILFSNKILNFMRIDFEENRFWVRPIPVIKGKRNTKIEEELFKEIPKFLRYLEQLPPLFTLPSNC